MILNNNESNNNKFDNSNNNNFGNNNFTNIFVQLLNTIEFIWNTINDIKD